MLKSLTLTLALAGVFASAGAPDADAKMRKGRIVSTAGASAFVSESCQALKEMAARQDRRGENYYTIQYIQCLNR